MGLFDIKSSADEYNIVIQPAKNGFIVANVEQDSRGDFENISVAANEKDTLKLVEEYMAKLKVKKEVKDEGSHY